jgi:hypothetical protein
MDQITLVVSPKFKSTSLLIILNQLEDSSVKKLFVIVKYDNKTQYFTKTFSFQIHNPNISELIYIRDSRQNIGFSAIKIK